MRQRIGFIVQLAVLMLLPTLIGWQLFFGMPLIVMPAALLVCIVLFAMAQRLRQS